MSDRQVISPDWLTWSSVRPRAGRTVPDDIANGLAARRRRPLGRLRQSTVSRLLGLKPTSTARSRARADRGSASHPSPSAAGPHGLTFLSHLERIATCAGRRARTCSVSGRNRTRQRPCDSSSLSSSRWLLPLRGARWKLRAAAVRRRARCTSITPLPRTHRRRTAAVIDRPRVQIITIAAPQRIIGQSLAARHAGATSYFPARCCRR